MNTWALALACRRIDAGKNSETSGGDHAEEIVTATYLESGLSARSSCTPSSAPGPTRAR